MKQIPKYFLGLKCGFTNVPENPHEAKVMTASIIKTISIYFYYGIKAKIPNCGIAAGLMSRGYN